MRIPDKPAKPNRPLRIMHLIPSLDPGGAEMMLYRLVSELGPERADHIVYSMCGNGSVGELLRQKGIEVRSLGMNRGTPDLRSILRLWRGMRNWKPDVVQTWMYHANLLGGVVAKLAGGIPLVWSLHHGDLREGPHRRLTMLALRAGAFFSGWLPARIVCCAESTREIHAGMGYRLSRMVVIPNGFDVQFFKPIQDARKVCQERMGIPEESEAAVIAGRFDPQKDHRNFLAAAKLLHKRFPGVLFLMCGKGITADNKDLANMLADAGPAGGVRLLGGRTPEEVAQLMSRSVLTSSAAFGEAFPCVIGEAMACGSVCVVTDVGDSARIVGDSGVVVRPRSPEALADALASVFSMSDAARTRMGLDARRRIELNFSIEKVASMYRNLYLELLR